MNECNVSLYSKKLNNIKLMDKTKRDIIECIDYNFKMILPNGNITYNNEISNDVEQYFYKNPIQKKLDFYLVSKILKRQKTIEFSLVPIVESA